MKAYCGSGGIASRILDLGTRWRWVFSLTPRPLYPRERTPRTHEDGWGRKPVWTRWWGEKFPANNGTRTPDHPARSTALYHWAIPILPYLCKVHFNISLPFTPRCPIYWGFITNTMYGDIIFCTCYTPCPSHPLLHGVSYRSLLAYSELEFRVCRKQNCKPQIKLITVIF
jgi:hypothetical protein